MPPNPMAFSFSVILSLPFILPDCSTWTACRTADAPRGMTIEPSIITGIVDDGLERHARPARHRRRSPASAGRSASCPRARVDRLRRRRPAAAGRAALRPGPAAGSPACARMNSTPTARSSGISRDLAALEEDAHGLAVAADEHALDHLAGLAACTLSADSGTPARQHEQQRAPSTAHVECSSGLRHVTWRWAARPRSADR